MNMDETKPEEFRVFSGDYCFLVASSRGRLWAKMAPSEDTLPFTLEETRHLQGSLTTETADAFLGEPMTDINESWLPFFALALHNAIKAFVTGEGIEK